MPQVKPIPTLFNICVKNFGRHCIQSLIINSVVKSDESRIELIQRKDPLLRCAKQYVHGFMIVLVRIEVLKFAVDEILHMRFECYEDLLNILFGADEVAKTEVLWKVLRDFLMIYGGKGIEELDFTCGVKVDNSGFSKLEVILSQTVFQDLSWAKNLVTLKLPDLWNAEIVKRIGCCQNLQHLDITSQSPLYQYRCSEQWSENPLIACLGYLYGCQNTANNVVVKENMGCPKLKTLALPQWGPCREVIDHVVKMVQFMPNLHVVKNIDARVVACRYIDVIGKLCKMNWTEFEDWDRSSCVEKKYEVVNASIGDFFPHVRSYTYYHNRNSFLTVPNDRGHLKLCNTFSCLEVLEVYQNNPFYLEDFVDADCMPSVKVFKLGLSDEPITVSDVQLFSGILPNLEKLVLSTSCYTCEDPEEEFHVDTFFQKLVVLQMNDVIELDASFLKKLLEKCPMLKTLELFCPGSSVLYLGEEACITDEFIQELSPSMKNLERVIFAQDYQSMTEPLRLSYSSVTTILDACPNIKCLGDLGEWKLSEAELHEFVNDIAQNNWDLELLYNTQPKEKVVWFRL